LWYEQTFTLTVTNVNEAPTALPLSNSTVAENQSAGTTVGTLSTTDPDVGDTFTYSLVAGTGSTDNSSFVVSGSTLETAAAFNYEVKNSYSIRVRTTDAGGLWYEQTFTLTVTNVNETPSKPTGSSPAGGATAVILTPTMQSSAFSDPDAGDTHAATQWQVDNGSDFASPVWDYEDTDSDKTSQAVPSAKLSYSTTYYWRVRYQDSHGVWSEWSDSRSFTVDRYSPVYRFWKPADNTHFYTIKESEKQKLIDNYSHIYTYEGVAYYAYVKDQPPAGTLPVYRFWKPSDGTHFYTIKESEKQKLIDHYAHIFTYEGPAYYTYGIAQHPVGTLPVYRFWKASDNTHFFTIKEREKDKLILLYSHVFTFEGIAWYAYVV
jgi:hypothetical protein